MSPYRIAVDTGGTFTDVVVASHDGTLYFNKALTTPARMFDGASEALRYIAADMGLDLESLMAQSELFIYGTTRATNAIVEKTTAPTAFFTTQGHPDILLFKEGGKHDPFNYNIPYPDPYVPRRLTREIRGRISAEGDVLVPLDEDAVREAVRSVKAAGAQAIAVCLIWSISNPAHELRVAEIIEEEWPGVPTTLSHRLNPIIREYRRASSAAIDASLKPLMQTHLSDIRSDLDGAGFRGELVVLTSFGGALHVDEVIQRPIYTVGSGPSMAPVASQAYGAAEGGFDNLIVGDSGGTTFDVSLVEAGAIKSTREKWLGPRWTGDITGLSSVEVTSIGAGGGSIAWVDVGGLLRVGPRSAGSVPGPVCYGRGGVDPTVTDAAAVLGFFDPAFFLDGRMPLDVEAATEAVRRVVAEPLSLDVKKAAWAIIAVANQSMVGAVREITINQGVDPRECAFVAGGGAGGLNAVMLAKELGCRMVLVPKTAATLSAAGGHFADIVARVSASRFTETGRFDVDAARDTLAALDRALDEFARRIPSGLAQTHTREYSVEARYPFQVWDLEVTIPERDFRAEGALEALRDEFHATHHRNFAVSEPGQEIEWDVWSATLRARLSPPDLGAQRAPARVERDRVRRRDVYFEESGTMQVDCYSGSSLTPGEVIDGPAIVEESTTTVVLPPGCRATLTELGSLLIEIGTDEEVARDDR
ncbi:MAG: hydantoinase/oxoprolinase family protein [Microbacterium sp.]